MNYYDELKDEIEAKINAHELEDALHLINTELKMPYVPTEFKQFLEDKLNQLVYDLKGNTNHTLSDEQLLEYLFKDDLLQLQACNELVNRNLRDYLDTIQHYFDSKPNLQGQCLLIDSLIRQEVNHEFKVKSRGQEITFNPRYLEEIEITDGYVGALNYLKNYFEDNEPSLYQLSQQILINECYLLLPMAFSADEASILANSIALYIMGLFYGDIGIADFCAKNKIESKHLIELCSEMIDICN